MNLDRTFCSGLRCGKTATCALWVGHLVEMRIPKDSERKVTISVAQFADYDGTCTKYESRSEDAPVEGHFSVDNLRLHEGVRSIGEEFKNTMRVNPIVGSPLEEFGVQFTETPKA